MFLVIYLTYSRSEQFENIPNKNIIVAMWYDNNIKDYGDLALDINKEYCHKHGYQFIFDKKNILCGYSDFPCQLQLI